MTLLNVQPGVGQEKRDRLTGSPVALCTPPVGGGGLGGLGGGGGETGGWRLAGWTADMSEGRAGGTHGHCRLACNLAACGLSTAGAMLWTPGRQTTEL